MTCHPALGQALHDAATNAFLCGLTVGTLVAGGAAAVGALLAVVFLPAQPTTPAAGQAQTAAAAHQAQAQADPATATH